MEQKEIAYKFVNLFVRYLQKIRQDTLTKESEYRLRDANIFTRKQYCLGLTSSFRKKTNTILNSSMHISIKYENYNVYLNAFLKNKTLAKQNLGYKNRKRRAEKLTVVNNKRAVDEFFEKLHRKLTELTFTNQLKTVIRVRGIPQLTHLKHCISKVRSMKKLKLIWIEDLNSMVYKSGLREKKPRRL